ncbi:MAG: LysE family transporter [Nitrospirae bacterium]|nr:LysE family transporter [Nitrospirota bacterium]
MESLAAIFATSFVVALSGALAPGPMFTLTFAEGVRGGWLAGPAVVFGHGVLELLLLALLVSGLGGVLASPVAVKVVGLAGGATLMVMGALMLARPSAPSAGTAAGRGPGFFRLAASGALTSISNPYWTLWWATVGMGYLALSGRLGMAGVGSFFGGHILADLAWFTLVSALAASGRRFAGGRLYAYVTCLCGAFLVFFGGWFIYASLSRAA